MKLFFFAVALAVVAAAVPIDLFAHQPVDDRRLNEHPPPYNNQGPPQRPLQGQHPEAPGRQPNPALPEPPHQQGDGRRPQSPPPGIPQHGPPHARRRNPGPQALRVGDPAARHREAHQAAAEAHRKAAVAHESPHLKEVHNRACEIHEAAAQKLGLSGWKYSQIVADMERAQESERSARDT